MKTKKAALNLITDILPEVLIIFLGMIRIKMFMQYLGEDNLGLYQLYGQIFAYVMIAESGFSTATLYCLYKPISEKSQEKVSKILSGVGIIFKYIALFMFFVGIIISFFLPNFIKNSIFTLPYLQGTFLLFLLVNIVSYFFQPYYIYYDAREEKYKINILCQLGLIAKAITEITLIVLHCNLYVILLSSLFVILTSNLLIKMKFKKDFPQIKLTKKRDYSMLKGTKNLFVHKVCGLVTNNIDILLLSKFIGLSKVVVYSSYNYIFNAINTMIIKIANSLYSIIGNNMITETKEKNYQTFFEINNMLWYISIVISSSLMYSISSFIYIYYGKKIVETTITVLMFITVLFLRTIRNPLYIFSNSSGLFKETKKCAIIELVVNLGLSLAFINNFGINGILFGTIISIVIADFIIRPQILYNNIFTSQKMKDYYINIIVLLIPLIILLYVNCIISAPKNNLIIWFLCSTLMFTINGLISLLYFKLVKKDQWWHRIKSLIKLKRGKNGKNK